MPTPQVTQQSAQQHRQPQQPQSPETRQQSQSQSGGSEIEVTPSEGDDGEPQQTGGSGGDPDGDGEPGPTPAQRHDPNDDSGGFGFLTSKKLIALIVVVAVVGIYLSYLREEGRGGGSGNPNAGGTSVPQRTADSVDDLDDALRDEPAGREFNVPQSRDDPLLADDYVLHETGIFPSFMDDRSNDGER